MPMPFRPRDEFPTPLFTATLPLVLAAAVALAVLVLRLIRTRLLVIAPVSPRQT